MRSSMYPLLMVALLAIGGALAGLGAQAQAPTYQFAFELAQADVTNVTRIEIHVDSVTRSAALPAPSNDASTPAGFNTYRIPMLVAERSPGRHDAASRACNAVVCSTDSNVFTYTVPQRPQNLTIRPGN